jgi:hypothetical protein
MEWVVYGRDGDDRSGCSILCVCTKGEEALVDYSATFFYLYINGLGGSILYNCAVLSARSTFCTHLNLDLSRTYLEAIHRR